MAELTRKQATARKAYPNVLRRNGLRDVPWERPVGHGPRSRERVVQVEPPDFAVGTAGGTRSPFPHQQRIFAIDSENRALIDQREHQKRINTEEQESNKLKGEAKTMLEAAMKPLDKYAETVAKIRDLEKKRYLDAEQAQKLEKKAAEDLKNAQAKEQGHMGEAYVRGTMEEYTERMRLEQEAGQRLRQAASAQSANGPNRAEERTATATEQLPAKLDIIAARLQSLSAPGRASEPAMVWR